MAGQRFQYDENGSTYVYFVQLCLAIILIPCSYYFIFKKNKESKKFQQEIICSCEKCQIKQANLIKKNLKNNKSSWKANVVKLVIGLGWLLFFYLVYKTSHDAREYASFDPYEILQVEVGASQSDIKNAYRKLSRIHHPDKATGDEKIFMMITKAHQALTDDIARSNWEKYGHPDGPQAISFGIALPSWIADREYSFWLLVFYAIMLMVVLPLSVKAWWNRSQYLGRTTKIFLYFFYKYQSMNPDRLLMVLSSSFEFNPFTSPDIKRRPSDNIEIPKLLKKFPQIDENHKEPILRASYSIKARCLLLAHLSRLKLPSSALDEDRSAVVEKCPGLIKEMVVCLSQLLLTTLNDQKNSKKKKGREKEEKGPAIPLLLVTLKTCMKLSAMIVQGFSESDHPLFQLPHISSYKYFTSKRFKTYSLERIARMNENDRRMLFQLLDDTEYEEFKNVLGRMPYVDIKVVDNKATTFTAGSIITVKTTLSRKNLSTFFSGEDDRKPIEIIENSDESDGKPESTTNKKKIWQPNTRKYKILKKSKVLKKHEKEEKEEKEDDENIIKESDCDDDNDSTSESSPEKYEKEIEKLQEKIAIKRRKFFEGKSQLSHSVHCPLYPLDKQENWWAYITDRYHQILYSPVHNITNLVEHEEIQLTLIAPSKPGKYYFTLWLRSDSYLGFDKSEEFKMDFEKAAETPVDHPQWEDLEEKSDHSDGPESGIVTDDDSD